MKSYLKLILIAIIEVIICFPSNAETDLNNVENKVKEWESKGWNLIGSSNHNEAVKKMYDVYQKVKDSDFIILSGYYSGGDKNLSYALLRCQLGAAYQWALTQQYHVFGVTDKYGRIKFSYDYMRYRETTISDAVKIIFPYLQEEVAIQKYQNDSLTVEAYYLIDTNSEIQVRLRNEYREREQAHWDYYEKLESELIEKNLGSGVGDAIRAYVEEHEILNTEQAETPSK